MIGTGLPCPCCSAKLQITIDYIIENPISAWPICKSVMKFPVNEELFKQYKEAQAEIQAIKTKYFK